jgi:type II secretory pathway component GspD/PulD (secretin)
MLLPNLRILTACPALLAAILGLSVSPHAARAQMPVQRILVPLGEPDTEETRLADALRAQPAKDYEFNRAALRDVLRFLAQDAGISYVSVPEIGAVENNLVTFSLHASPFRALEIIAKANGVALFYEDGVWYLRPYNDKELIGRTYKIKYNTQEEVKYDGDGSTSPSASTSGLGGTQSGSGTTPDLGLSLTGKTNVFKVDPKQLIDDIKALLGIPTTGLEGSVAKEASVDNAGDLAAPRSVGGAGAPDGGGKTAAGTTGGPQVIWNSDSNTLYVVATRQQHQWVEGYLNSMDRPQPLIAVEVKFFETTKDPRKQLGVNWDGTLGNGITFNGSANVSTSGALNIDQKNDHQSQYGVLPADDTSGAYNYNQNNKTTTVTASTPYSAVLSLEQVSLTIQALLSDRNTSTVSYPRALTRNNREVVIRSVINQPVLASTSSVTPGVGGTTTASVSYLPIGTIINVLPKTMTDGSVQLNVAITISSIVGEQPIQGNLYPIATTRVYNAALQVDSGYTLAIGGIEEASDKWLRNGVPFLKDIPLLGEAFKSNDRTRSKKNLMFFITPTVLGTHTHVGVAEKPESTLPVPPSEPAPPAFAPDGQLAGGEPALQSAIAWLTWQERYYREFIRENRTDRHTIERINAIISTCELLLTQVENFRQIGVASSARLDAQFAEIDRLRASFLDILRKAKKDVIF